MANDVYQLVMRGTSRGQFWECVQHFQSDAASVANPVARADDLIDSFIGAVLPLVSALQSEETEVTGFTSKRVNNGGSPSVLTPIAAVPGDIASDPLPGANGYLFNLAYSHMSVFRTGKMFLPGIPESLIDGQEYAAGALTAAAALIGDMSVISGGLGDYVWGVWSREHSLFFVPPFIQLSPKVGIQRRRLLPIF